ncbi:cytochrome C biogenesis protein CcdA [Amycolatopsis antarctica]|uniref:Cytochrome C biogenesis protein CcdA n=1 Tax=Amycolatopsis antarctica TaxID=1854586 RepID=A0A263D489_9PSEU|nr:cytochrome c biogenesis protein CcdA [Amycolatopsis antarctica]OZM73302.1 cytochrome C biogenesis protein CcdA [Amycolatopsis antarctica]
MIEAGLLGAFLGGLLSLLSPCSALLLPSFFAYAFTSVTTLAARTALFLAGLAAVLVPIGAGAGALGGLLTVHRDAVTLGAGLLLLGFGVFSLFGKGFRLDGGLSTRVRQASVFALGAVYGLAGFCAGPLLGSVLTASAAGGSPVYGGALMVAYALGMALPLFVLALLWDRYALGERSWLRGRELSAGRLRVHTTNLVSGLLFVGIGVLFLTTDGTAALGGLSGVDGQFAAQSAVRDAVAGIPDAAVALVLVLLALAVVLVRIARRSRSPR